MKRVFIIHGWGGNSQEAWIPWLKSELEKHQFQVTALDMPNTDHPKIAVWVETLAQAVGEPDTDTYLVGHSVGCQTILRYLESLPGHQVAGGVVLVAGWLTLAGVEDEERPIAEPWLNTPIDFQKVKTHARNFVALFSDDDPVVPLENVHVFRDGLDAEINTLHQKGHMAGDDGMTELPEALEAIQKISR